MAEHPLPTTPERHWVTRFCRPNDPREGDPLVLQGGNGVWSLAADQSDNNKSNNLERIRVNPEAGSICLDVPPPPPAHNGGQCLYTLVSSDRDQSDRGRWGYIACNSAFVQCSGSWSDATLVVPIFNGIFLGHVCEPFVNHDALWAAALNVDAVGNTLRHREQKRIAEERERAEAEREAAKRQREQADRAAALRRTLGSPALWGLELGVDTPDSVATKLAIVKRPCTMAANAARYLHGLCWTRALGRDDVIEGYAHFVDVGGKEPVLERVGLTFAPESWDAVYGLLRATWGTEDRRTWNNVHSVEWSWGRRGQVELFRLLNSVRDAPSIDGNQVQLNFGEYLLSEFAEARRQPDPRLGTTVRAEPWGLRFGEDSVSTALSKLQQAGFEKELGCLDMTRNASQRTAWTCYMSQKRIGIDSASVEFVQPEGGRPLLSGLSYRISWLRAREVMDDLQAHYGEPIPNRYSKDPEWAVGNVEITTMHDDDEKDPSQRWLGVQYHHGRLWNIGLAAHNDSNQVERDYRRQGL